MCQSSIYRITKKMIVSRRYLLKLNTGQFPEINIYRENNSSYLIQVTWFPFSLVTTYSLLLRSVPRKERLFLGGNNFFFPFRLDPDWLGRETFFFESYTPCRGIIFPSNFKASPFTWMNEWSNSIFYFTAKVDWTKGLVSGAVYNGAPELTKLLTEVS